MNIKVFGVYLYFDSDSEWIESSSCNITNRIDAFRELESDDSYIYVLHEDIAVVISLDDIKNEEPNIFFLDVVSERCIQKQDRKFTSLFERLNLIIK